MSNYEGSPWKYTLLGLLLSAIAIALLALFGSEAKAESLSKLSDKAVMFSGEFTKGASQRLKYYLTNNPGTKEVVFKSPGGILQEGLEVGYVLHGNKLTAIVMKGDKCLSACAFAFLGADKQAILGTLGFHRAWMEDRVATQNKILGDGQAIGGYTLWYVLKMGYHSQLAYLIQSQTNQGTYLVFTNKADLDLLFVSSDSEAGVGKFLEFLPNLTQEWVKQHIKKGSEL